MKTNRILKGMTINILRFIAILAIAFPSIGSASAQETVPWLIAFPENNMVEGWEWPDGATISMSINDITHPEWSGVAHVTDWGDTRTYVSIEIGEEYDLQFGDEIILTDESGTTATHTVQALSITDVNGVTDTVSGTANIGTTVQIWPHGHDTDLTIEVLVEDGTWVANFGDLEFYNIEETGGRAQIIVDGNATAVNWQTNNPHFTVFPDWEFFDGLDWPDDADVTITVANKPECTTSQESWGGFFNGNFGEGCNIEFGDEVTFTDGTTTRTHNVRNQFVTDVNIFDNTVSGKADVGAGTIVYVWPHDGDFEPLEATVDEFGDWQVNFSEAGYTLRDDSEGRAEIRDEMGNATAEDWHVTHPHFTVFPEWEWFDGVDWPNGATVEITVSGKDECTTVKESWGYFFNGSFGEECNIVVGDEVSFTDGVTTRTNTVLNLAVTEVHQEDDTVKGTADPGKEVYVWPHATGQELVVIVKNQGNAAGKWNADFTGIFDLVPGECGRSEIRDEYANATAVDWCISNPTFVAYMPMTIVGYDWHKGDTIALSINDGEYVAQADVGNADWDPTVVLFNLWQDDFIMEAGDHIVMTDLDMGIEKDLWVTNLTVIDFDLSNGKVFGVYDPAYDLWVWLYDWEGQVPETDSINGTWEATFPELSLSELGGATQWDGDGDGTSIDFPIPKELYTRVVVANQPDWVDSGITISEGKFTIEALGLMNPCSDTYPNGADYCIFYTPLGARWDVPEWNQFGFFPAPGLPFMALLGRIGDGDPFYVGAGGDFTSEQYGTGVLWFTPNDNLRTDNQGEYNVLVWFEQ